MKNALLAGTLMFMSATTHAQTEVNYSITIENPSTHYALIGIEVSHVKDKVLTIKMPVWTPGSYMIREFEKNVEKVYAEAGGKSLQVMKSDKNTWLIDNQGKSDKIKIQYRIYCFEKTVRTSYIDQDHAFLLPTSLLMLVDQGAGGKVSLKYPDFWTQISTTLKPVSENEFTYESFDELADSPVEIGNQQVLSFQIGEVRHRIALVGRNNCPVEKLVADVSKICKTMMEVVGNMPCKDYLFIVHHVDAGGGGLEHANSSVLQMPRFAYSNRDRYLSFLSLCAHEYFHLWNIKRIRPAALGPFDYSRENYTNLLWVAEGITSYYDELVMYRAGFRTQHEYLRILAGTISSTLNRKGAFVQSLHEASFDAWIKEYRPNENSINSQISYYMKGTVVAAMLDIEIIAATAGNKSLDDLMKYLFETYYQNKKRGFTDDEFYTAIDHVAGRKLNFREWAEKPNDNSLNDKISEVLQKVSCKIRNKAEAGKYYTGILTEMKGEKLLVRSIEAGSPAFAKDIQAGDELISAGGIRISSSLDEVIKLLPAGEEFEILLSRAGLMRTVFIKTADSNALDLQIMPLNEDAELYKIWLKKQA